MEMNKNTLQKIALAHKQINSNDPDWSLSEQTLRDYDSAVASYSKEMANYSHATNAFSDLVSDKKLFYVTDVTSVITRVNETALAAQRQLQVIDADIKAAESMANQNGHPSDAPEHSTIKAERDLFEKNAKILRELSLQLKSSAENHPQMASTDPQWPLFQKWVAEAEIKSKELDDISRRLPGEIETFTNSSSR
jgi:hypothetical protein